MEFEDFVMEEEGGKSYNIRHRCFYFSKIHVMLIKKK